MLNFLTMKGDGKKKELKLVGGLFLLSLVIRIIYAFFIKVDPWCDMAGYNQMALSILENGLGKNYEFISQPPLYPLFLAAIFRVFGHSYLAVRLTQALISAGTCVLIYLIGKNVFSKKVGTIACLISVFYFDFISYSGILMAETLSLFLFLLVIYVIIKNKALNLAAIIYGLTILTKPLYLVILPGLIIWIFLKEKKNKFLKILKFAIFVFLTVSPWIARNYFIVNKLILSSTGGEAFYIGHNPSADGGCNFDFTKYEYGSFYLDKTLSPIERSEIAKKKAVNYIIHHPRREIELIFLKLARYWSLKSRFDFYTANYPLRGVFFFSMIVINAILFPLCFLAMLYPRKSKNNWGLTILILNFTLVFITVFSAFGRMSFPIMPIVIILSVYGLYTAPEVFRSVKTKGVRVCVKRMLLLIFSTGYIYGFFIYQLISRYKQVMEILRR